MHLTVYRAKADTPIFNRLSGIFFAKVINLVRSRDPLYSISYTHTCTGSYFLHTCTNNNILTLNCVLVTCGAKYEKKVLFLIRKMLCRHRSFGGFFSSPRQRSCIAAAFDARRHSLCCACPLSPPLPPFAYSAVWHTQLLS